MANSFTMWLVGVDGVRRAVQLTDANTRRNVVGVINRGTKAVVAIAKARVPRRTGELAETLRAEFSKDGLTGYAKAGFGRLLRRSRAMSDEGRARFTARRELRRYKLALAGSSRQALSVLDLGVYAPVVERGDPRRHHLAHPYVTPALALERPAIVAGLEAAPKKAAQDAGLVA